MQSRDIGRTVPAVREAIRFSTLDLVGFFPWPISKNLFLRAALEPDARVRAVTSSRRLADCVAHPRLFCERVYPGESPDISEWKVVHSLINALEIADRREC